MVAVVVHPLANAMRRPTSLNLHLQLNDRPLLVCQRSTSVCNAGLKESSVLAGEAFFCRSVNGDNATRS